MSVQTQIDRISGQVSTQKALISQIRAALQGKGSGGGGEPELTYTVGVNGEGLLLAFINNYMVFCDEKIAIPFKFADESTPCCDGFAIAAVLGSFSSVSGVTVTVNGEPVDIPYTLYYADDGSCFASLGSTAEGATAWYLPGDEVIITAIS